MSGTALPDWFAVLQAAGRAITPKGALVAGDARAVLREHAPDGSVDLIIASPPFEQLSRGDDEAELSAAYREWFRPLGAEFHRALKDSGSLVLELGGVWLPGQPTRGLYHFELLIMLCRELGFHLAQEFYSFNPRTRARKTPWPEARQLRLRDSVHCLWWLSRTPWPKASPRRAASGSSTQGRPNLLSVPPADANPAYLAYCAAHGLKAHPARFPAALPEFFIRLLTGPGDIVVDPFAGSCVTGEVAQRLDRRWACIELDGEYLEGAVGRFQ